MAIYSGTFNNVENQPVVVQVRDGSGGTTQTVRFADKPMVITYTATDEDDHFAPIVTSRCKLRFFIEDSEASNALLQDMANAKDGEWVVTISINAGLSGRWSGYVIPDGVTTGISYFNNIIEVQCIDPLEYCKGQKLTQADGTKFFGKHRLYDYIGAIIANATSVSALIPYTYRESTNLVIDVSPGIFLENEVTKQLWVDASKFNDNRGRPLNSFEVLEKIAKALCMRCEIINGGSSIEVWMHDVFPVPDTSSINVGAKELGAVNYLLGNRENLTRKKTSKEVSVEFKYEGSVGLLLNGDMSGYEVSGQPTDVDVNPPLSALPDMNVRKRGTGRPENPYGFVLHSTVYDIGTGTLLMDTMDMLGFHTASEAVTFGQLLELTVRAEIEYLRNLNDYSPTSGANAGDRQRNTRMFCQAFFYNEDDPTLSSYLGYVGTGDDRKLAWYNIDLTGTGFASGQYDFTVRNPDTIAHTTIMGYVDFYGTPLTFSAETGKIQTASIELPAIQGTGQVFVGISQILNPSRGSFWASVAEANASAQYDTVIYEVLLSTKRRDSLINGEKVYISRLSKSSILASENEIELNTSSDSSVSGALWTGLTFTGAQNIGPGYVHFLYSLTPEATAWIPVGKFTLLTYNAFVRMAFNTLNVKIDFEMYTTNMQPHFLINLSSLYDAAKPSTAIYNAPFLVMRQDYDVKACTRSITALSMAIESRGLSDTDLDLGHDLLEVLNIRNGQ